LNKPSQPVIVDDGPPLRLRAVRIHMDRLHHVVSVRVLRLSGRWRPHPEQECRRVAIGYITS